MPVAALMIWSVVGAPHEARAIEPLTLEVDGEGIAVATSILTLPGPPALARHLVSDASNWPALFVSPVRVESEVREGDRAVTEMYWSAPLWLGELHLVVETLAGPPHRVEPRLIRGDVRRYPHVWQLAPLAGEPCTRAVLELTMQLDTWAPKWLLRWLMRRELNGHLERVVSEAGRLLVQGSPASPTSRPKVGLVD